MSSEDISDNVPPKAPGGLLKSEHYWRDRQPWLQEHGYLLRARYRPDWKPSWEGTNKNYSQCEDGRALMHPYILDATRISDGGMVMLKKTSKSLHPHEADIGQLFSTQPLSSDPRNHCIPIYDVLQDPLEEDSQILVMPLLRSYDNPRFQTIGEALEFFRQVFEGLQFMHENHVAHRDIMSLNTMMDPVPMFPELFHPRRQNMKRDFSGPVKPLTRTQRPTKYFFVDFGHARKYNPDDGSPLELPLFGGDRTVPEFQEDGYDKPYNPFPTDIYYLGNLIREEFLQKYSGLDFMDTLVGDMVQHDPTKRPSIDTVADRFDKIRRTLSVRKCRSRLVSKKEDVITRAFLDIRHAFRTVNYIIRRLPATPTPSNKV